MCHRRSSAAFPPTAALVLAVLLVGCDTPLLQSPLMDKAAVALMTSDPVVDGISNAIYDQWVIGKAEEEGRLLPESKLVEHPAYRIFNDIREAALRSKYADTAKAYDDQGKWELNIIKDDDNENAFGLPGGKIVIYTGMFLPAHNEGRLAAVLGHEVTHILARHGAERVKRDLEAMVRAKDIVTGALDVANLDPAELTVLMGALGIGILVGVDRPFAWEAEFEADYEGLRLAAAAGYDPQEARGLWGDLVGAEKAQYLSAHPSGEARVNKLEAGIDEFESVYKEADVKQDSKASVPLPEI